MKKKGWTEKAFTKMGVQSVLMYEKKGRIVNIAIAPIQQELQISITVTQN
ncbi:hypothetical protein [Thermodesulfatator autotrophicus]|nr:hypothetical protein [Thermodesulfatator autotrophicus]